VIFEEDEGIMCDPSPLDFTERFFKEAFVLLILMVVPLWFCWAAAALAASTSFFECRKQHLLP
jgi:hypothetical protein